VADLLVADDLKKVYGTAVPTLALKDVSFTLEEGELASIVGQSGSGKSTLLNLLGLLDTPTEGAVTLDGRQTAGLGKRGLAGMRNELLGFVFQFHYLLPEFSVLENVTMPARIGGAKVTPRLKSRAEEVLALLGLEGLEGKNANQLSGGQKQRVAIARALINDPLLLLADEPTGNLDPTTSAGIMRLLDRINRTGTTVVMATHDRSSVDSMRKRVVELDDGRVVRDQHRGVYA
jgi:lipoprotein-releasing system ATP-binding protein